MDVEKRPLDPSSTAQDELDHPTTSPRRSTRRRLGAHILLLAGIAFLVYSHFVFSTSSKSESRELINDAAISLDPVVGYWAGIASKGMGAAVGCGKKHNVDHHSHHAVEDMKHHNKHKHHGKHGKHGSDHNKHHGKHGDRMPKIIPPKEAERIYLTVPNNESARDAAHRYTSHAHSAGSGFDFINALSLKNEWERALGVPVSGPEEHLYDAGSHQSQSRIHNGMDKLGVWVDTYYPVMNTPVWSSVTLLTDPPVHAKLREDIVEGDPDSTLRDEVRVFHGLSVSGDVTGKFVYAGYGRKADFNLLEEKGISLKGSIAIVKYGAVFRGLKVKAAQEAGAIGCIIFSDPGDDGGITAENGYDIYPDGPARQPSSVQRGSVQFLSVYPGDPTTPGEPAYKNASRVEGGNFPSIPSLPMSFEDVIPILQQLKGKGIAASELGDAWVGALGYYGVEYFTGPSEIDLHLVNDVNTRVMPIWNTMAVIPGHITDEVIVMGNHRDAWVLGGSDAQSGTATQHEMVQGLGKLIQSGWKPLRTILLASWDAEEYGLIGSTEWAEDFGKFLEKEAAVYLNLDSSVAGNRFGSSASPSLSWLVRGAAQDVLSSSDQSVTVWDLHEIESQGDHEKESFAELAASELGIGVLGSGSDYTAFLQRYGVASVDMSFGGAKGDPVYHYHSIYDSFHFMDKFMDPGYHKHVDMAKVMGLALLRLSDSLVLPINVTQYSVELSAYLDKVEHIASSQNVRDDLDLKSLSESINSLIANSISLDAAKHTALGRLRKLLPKPKNAKHSLLSEIKHAWRVLSSCWGSKKISEQHSGMQLWQDSELSLESQVSEVMRYHHHSARHHDDKNPMTRDGARVPIAGGAKNVKEIKKVLEEIRGINKKLQGFEGGFISEDGLEGREWYKHKGVAPGLWLGYGATTFPALTEALTISKDVGKAQKEADELAEMIDAMAQRLAE